MAEKNDLVFKNLQKIFLDLGVDLEFNQGKYKAKIN